MRPSIGTQETNVLMFPMESILFIINMTVIFLRKVQMYYPLGTQWLYLLSVISMIIIFQLFDRYVHKVDEKHVTDIIDWNYKLHGHVPLSFYSVNTVHVFYNQDEKLYVLSIE